MKEQGFFDKIKDVFKGRIQQYTMIFAMLVIWFYFQMTTNGVFLSPRNLNNLFLQMCYIGIAACGMVLIMIAGHIDLSIGSVIGFTGAVIAVLLRDFNLGIVPALLITLVVGLLVGLWQGFWVAYVGLPAFIVTLSSTMLFRGGVLGVTQGNTVQPNNSFFKTIGQGYIPDFTENINVNMVAVVAGIAFILIFIISKVIERKNRKKYNFVVDSLPLFIVKLVIVSIIINLIFSIWANDRGLPVPIIILALVVFIMNIVSKKTPFGRHVYAVGGNAEATELSGVNVKKTTLGVFAIMGLLSAVSGVVYTSRLNAAAIAGGTGAESDIIAAAIIGGTSPSGGKGTILGCIIGALIMASLENGMSILSLGSFEKYVVKGLVLLFAVAADTLMNKDKL